MELAVDHRTPRRSDPPSRQGLSEGDALSKVLAELGDRVKPVALARERTMPVASVFDELLPDDGLVRGRVVSCHGAAAATSAFGLVAEALVAGAWMAVVDVATFGADAAAEMGVPLERVVRVDTGVDGGRVGVSTWIDVVAAAVDGFDIVVTSVPEALRGDRRPSAVRTLAKRIQQHGAVVVVLGESGALSSDVALHTVTSVWSGLGAGEGYLRRRRVEVEASGRRVPGGRRSSIELVGDGHRIELVSTTGSDVAGRDPQAELLAEMAAIEVHDLADDEESGGGEIHRLVG